MAQTALRVLERTEKPNVSRRDGFIPGAIFGASMEKVISIKVEAQQLERILKKQASNARLQLVLGDTDTFCLVKEVQRDVVNGKILHVDFQAVAKDENVKLKIPIIYEGIGRLEANGLMLLVNENDLELEGSLNLLPESITVDVSDKNMGDKVLAGDIGLNSGVKASRADEGKILAVVVAHKVNVVEETEGDAGAEASAEAGAGEDSESGEEE